MSFILASDTSAIFVLMLSGGLVGVFFWLTMACIWVACCPSLRGMLAWQVPLVMGLIILGSLLIHSSLPGSAQATELGGFLLLVVDTVLLVILGLTFWLGRQALKRRAYVPEIAVGFRVLIVLAMTFIPPVVLPVLVFALDFL